MSTIRQASAIKRLSLAEQIGIAKTERSVVSRLHPTETHFQSKTSSELWINIGGKDFRLIGKSVRIGRADDNDIVLEHKSVSRYHALLSIRNNEVILEDLKSRNGISVNATPVKRAQLSDNDEVLIGDLRGLFFERAKKAATETDEKYFSPADLFEQVVERVQSFELVERLEALGPKRKKIMMAVGAVLFVAAGLFLLNPQHAPTMIDRSILTTSAESDIRPSDRSAFERCLEAEDLGNLRQANLCFGNLAQTTEVQIALDRVQKRQAEISEERYREGKQALENYYYDIALQKFQEVILVSDDSSEYRLQASRGIQDAEERMRR